MSLKEQLRRLRQKAGLTQEALARSANLSVSTIVKLERGVMDPSWTTVLRLAEALGVGVGEFAVELPVKPKKKAK